MTRRQRNLADSHASCSSFISLGNSAKKHITAQVLIFMLKSRLAANKDGLKKKKRKKKTIKKPNQIHPKLSCTFISPRKFKSWNISLKLFRIFHSGGTHRVLQGARGPCPPWWAEGHIPPGWHRQAPSFGCTPSFPRNYMKTKPSLSMENKLLICIKVYSFPPPPPLMQSSFDQERLSSPYQ